MGDGRTALVFADVTTLLSRGDYGAEQTRAVADHDFEEAKMHLTENKNLLLNNNKTQNLVCTLGRHRMPNKETSSVRLLGFELDGRLMSWKAHIGSPVCRRLSWFTYMIKKLKTFVREDHTFLLTRYL